MDDQTETDIRTAATSDEAAVGPPLRKQRLLAGLTGEESSRRWTGAPHSPLADERRIVKRTYELEESIVAGIRRQAIVLGVNANELANALLKHGLAALVSGAIYAEVGILPEDQVRGPRAAGRYITALRRGDQGKEG